MRNLDFNTLIVEGFSSDPHDRFKMSQKEEEPSLAIKVPGALLSLNTKFIQTQLPDTFLGKLIDRPLADESILELRIDSQDFMLAYAYMITGHTPWTESVKRSLSLLTTLDFFGVLPNRMCEVKHRIENFPSGPCQIMRIGHFSNPITFCVYPVTMWEKKDFYRNVLYPTQDRKEAPVNEWIKLSAFYHDTQKGSEDYFDSPLSGVRTPEDLYKPEHKSGLRKILNSSVAEDFDPIEVLAIILEQHSRMWVPSDDKLSQLSLRDVDRIVEFLFPMDITKTKLEYQVRLMMEYNQNFVQEDDLSIPDYYDFHPEEGVWNWRRGPFDPNVENLIKIPKRSLNVVLASNAMDVGGACHVFFLPSGHSLEREESISKAARHEHFQSFGM